MKNYDLCFVENIDIIKNKTLTSKKIVIEVDSHHTSKTCSHCRNIQNLKLHQRSWTCKVCKYKHDRDVNAAKNILQKGFKTYQHSKTRV